MPDEPNRNKKPIVVVVVVLLLCGLVAAWLVSRARRAPNLPPIAALRLDSIDETNRLATISDGGSHDPDGSLQSWRIAWGDGKEETLSAVPEKAAHTYASEGEYTISLWCVDNRGATSSPPAMTNITFDFLKRQKALELAQAEAKREAERLEEARKQAEAKREAERLKQEEARKQAERLEQERQKQQELAAMQAQKAKEQQDLEAKQKAEAELARQKAAEAATSPLAAALPDNSSSRIVSYTPPGCTLGEFQISKAGTEGTEKDGKLLVILVTRCVNFPHTAVPTSDWQIDGKDVRLQASRIRASLSPGRHEVTALFKPGAGLQPTEIKADVTVETNGECVVTPTK
jgi:PKD domain